MTLINDPLIKHKIGRTIRLDYTDDPYTRLNLGMLGKVTGFSKDNIDGGMQVHVIWETGSTLSLIEGHDRFHIFDEREEFMHALSKHIDSTMNLVVAWESIREDNRLYELVEDTQWPFAMSLDEYASEIHGIYEQMLAELEMERQ